MARPHMHLAGGQWCLWRLADDEFVSLGHHALPLLQNYELLLRLGPRLFRDGTTLTLGHALTVLERRFGPSSPLFDNYRGSFSFPLLLTIERQQRLSYLLRCHDHRGMLHFPFYRVTPGDPSVEERSRCHAPVPEEFSQEEMDEFITEFYRFLFEQGYLLETGLVAPFYRAIESDIILYGYDGNKFFQQMHDSWNEYVRARQELEQKCGVRRPRSTSDRVERIIDRVTELNSPCNGATAEGFATGDVITVSARSA